MHVPIFKKNAKTYLGENPDLNVMRYRTLADEHFRTTNLFAWKALISVNLEDGTLVQE